MKFLPRAGLLNSRDSTEKLLFAKEKDVEKRKRKKN